jgi:WXG100 family type VII secretion target
VIAVAMDGFGTTTEEMTRAAGHVTAVNDTVQNELSALRGKLAPLAGAWSGQAASQFTALMARWDADAQNLNGALRAIGEALRGSGATYQAQEDQQAGAMASITQALS